MILRASVWTNWHIGLFLFTTKSTKDTNVSDICEYKRHGFMENARRGMGHHGGVAPTDLIHESFALFAVNLFSFVLFVSFVVDISSQETQKTP